MRVLILSCNTGGGHNSAGSAILEALRARGHTGERVDFLGLTEKRVSQLVSGAYVGMARKLPAMFGVTYGMGRAVSSAEHLLGLRSPVYLACSQAIPGLERYLASRPWDAVVAPHLFPALALTEMRRRGLPLPLTAAVATDYTCIPFFQEQDCDYIIIPGAVEAEEFTRRGIPRKKLVPVGIPVSADFLRRVGRLESRRLLGLAETGRWVLLMGGSMGSGRIAQLARYLLYLTPPDVHIAVICGSNRKLLRVLQRRYEGSDRVRVAGHTDQVARYMEASDLLYTKPGGITSTEGAVMGVPMVHMAPIPGCETRNRQIFTHSGMSVSARGILLQAMKGKQLLDDPDRCRRMLENQRRQMTGDAAGQIVRFLETEAVGRLKRR